ncbi:quinone-dependent dihydroorotate dehydrogenase [Patescibacteria group bacterium]|nr:quinone-dependent dihydroorotate dehydrogenase [Patescibacteria group bacterium]
MRREMFTKIRNWIIGFLYKWIAKPIFFSMDPEFIHVWMVRFSRVLQSNPVTRAITGFFFTYKNKKLSQKIEGIKFETPLGLAAGFDKDAEIVETIRLSGFGFSEVGSITADPCEGNPRPRLWRIINEKSLRVNYGLKNNGAEAIASRMERTKYKMPVLISIARTNCRETCGRDQGVKDYLRTYKRFKNIGDMDVLNISCPNSYGAETFLKTGNVRALLMEIKKIRNEKPLLLKISPDLNRQSLDEIVELAQMYGVDGFICTNLSKKEKSRGGLSGKNIERKANRVISHIYEKTRGKMLIIGVGGIFSAKDAYKKIKLGANLLQLITGMIYEGPQLMSEINRGMVELLEKDGYSNIQEAVGKGN